MPSRTTGGGTHRISLQEYDGSDDWFEIAEALSFPDRIEVNDALMRPSVASPGMFDYTQHHGRFVQLAKALRGWSFTQAVRVNGEEREEPWELPGTEPGRREELTRLDGDLGAWMALQVDLYYGRRKVGPPDPPTGGSTSAPSPVSTPAAKAPASRPAGGAGTA
jgi:hypothetical protein